MRRIIKFLAAVLSGVNMKTAWYFSNWYWDGAFKNVKSLRFSGEALVNRTNKSSLQEKMIGIFYPRLDWLNWLMNHYQFEASDDPNTIVMAGNAIDGHRALFPIRTYFDILVIIEMLRDKIYEWIPPDPAIMIDFGMNHGLVSLLSASTGRFKKIYAYELVPSTFENASKNFALNTWLKETLIAKNAAVGKSDRMIDVSNFEPGSVTAHVYSNNQKGTSNQQVRMLIAGEEISKIIGDHPKQPVFLKMDIEGAELEVIESLVECKMLSNIDCMIIECHANSEISIMETLRIHQFACKLLPMPECPDNALLFAHLVKR